MWPSISNVMSVLKDIFEIVTLVIIFAVILKFVLTSGEEKENGVIIF